MDEKTRMLAGRIGPCPTCGNGRLAAVSDGEQTNFLCHGCGSCWRVELGWTDRVNPENCPGCASRTVCEDPLAPYGERLGGTR